jgi:5-hydroxyisourate hydrolase
MNRITTHVLDTVLGKPASGIQVRLELQVGEEWKLAGSSVTDSDGRCLDLVENPDRGTYRLVFSTGEFLRGQGRSTIYPQIEIVFECSGDAHYHLPLLLSDNCFTTYRGS